MARKMKDSGIEWIGEIPENWGIERLKHNCSVMSGYPFDSSLFSNESGFPLIRIRDISSGKTETFYSGEYPQEVIVHNNDLLAGMDGDFNIRWWQGGDALLNQRCCKVTTFERVSLRFLFYLLPYRLERINELTYATTVKHLAVTDITESKIPVPSVAEQNRITEFLDKQCLYIDSVLEQTRFSIEEYKKLKQTIITQAVTKGVRGDRPMKDSGIEWIGEVPTDWRVTQLRHCATVKSGITLGKTYEKNVTLYEMPYLRVANVQDGYVSMEDVATLAVTEDEIEKYRLHVGDVLMTEGGDRDKLGRGCVWDGRIDPCLHQNHIFAVHTDETFLLPRFLEYLTASKVGRCYFDVTAIKTTNLACTSSSKVLAFSIPLPGTDEQAEIVTYLKKKCSAIDTLIAKKQAVLTELENYKKSTIYEYVTGKKEVTIC